MATEDLEATEEQVNLAGAQITTELLGLWTGSLIIPSGTYRFRVLTRFVLKYTLRAAHLELGGVDLDLAVEDDVLPLDRADMTQQVGVEREVRRGGNP